MVDSTVVTLASCCRLTSIIRNNTCHRYKICYDSVSEDYVLFLQEFGQMILRKIIEIVATGCQNLRLKCTNFDFGWGSASALQTP